MLVRSLHSTRAIAALLLVLVLPVAPAWADAPALRNGRAHYLGARFEEAERAFQSVVEDGRSTRADLAEAFRYLAVLRLVRGMSDDAK